MHQWAKHTKHADRSRKFFQLPISPLPSAFSQLWIKTTVFPAWAALTNVSFNNRHFFLTAWEASKSKIKVPANLIPGGNVFSGLQMAAF